MLRRRDNFALYSELLVSPGLNKLVALVIMLYPITEREGLLELEQGYHHLPVTSIYIGGSQGSCVAELQLLLLKLTFSTNEEAPRRSLRQWGPLGHRPAKGSADLAQLPTAFSLRPVVDTWVPQSLACGIASCKSVYLLHVGPWILALASDWSR